MAKMKVDIVDGPIDLGKPGKPRYRTVHKDGKAVQLRQGKEKVLEENKAIRDKI